MSFSVLITAASRRVALVKTFKNAINKIGGKLIAVDCDKYSSALYFADKHYLVPLVNDKDYIKIIKDIAQKENVKLIIPTIDYELMLWAENKRRFDEIGISVSVSPKKTIKICSDKLSTYNFFIKNNFPFPKSFTPDNLPEKINFPLFIKPRRGRGSDDSIKINNNEEFEFYIKKGEYPLISEFLDGDEFTTDALFSKKGKLLRCVHRYRLIVRAGVSDRGKTFKNKKLTSYIENIGKKLKFEGAVNIQGKISADRVSFFEINPRFSGGIQLTIASGANFPQIIIDELSGNDISSALYDYEDKLLMTSFEDSLFIDNNNSTIKM
jgi:carbamoyl-phosphate synthase large subunit